MATFEEYWNGTVRAQLNQGDFSAEMLHTLYRGAPVSTFCNRALGLFYNARQSIGLCRDLTLQRRMTEALEDAATAGSGRGVSDLEEAFQHMAQFQGSWFDENVATYQGGRRKFFGSSVPAPEALVNFANAVDEATGDLVEVVEQFTSLQSTVAETIRHSGTAPSDWRRLGDATAEVASWSERAGHLLWVVDAPESLNSGVALVGSFASNVNELHTAMTTAVHLQHAGAGGDMARGLAALHVVSSKLPILGQIYTRAIEVLPDLVAHYKGLIRGRQSLLETISRAGYTDRRHVPRPGTQSL